VTDVTGSSIRCNVNNGAVAGKCAVAAGTTVSVEMHQVLNSISIKSNLTLSSKMGTVVAVAKLLVALIMDRYWFISLKYPILQRPMDLVGGSRSFKIRGLRYDIARTLGILLILSGGWLNRRR
jgi:hypothetical protein